MATAGIQFERRPKDFPLPSGGGRFEHFTSYEIVPAGQGFRYWTRAGDRAIHLREIQAELSGSVSAASVWAAVQESRDRRPVSESGGPIDRSFGIELVISASGPSNLCNFMKPLLDGVISACQPCDDVDDELIRRVANQTRRPEHLIRRWLTRHDGDFLSHLCPARLYREGVMWHPDDHRCKAAQILLECRPGLTNPNLEFSIYPVV